MRYGRVAIGLAALLLILCASVATVWLANGAQAGGRRRPAAMDGAGPMMNPKAVAVRVLLGVRDQQPTVWDGDLKLSQGEVIAIQGWRFAEGDRVEGKTAWKASTRRVPLQGAARQRRQQRRQGNPPGGAAAQGPMAENGVIITLDAPETTKVDVTTKQGNFSFQLSDLPYGKTLRALDGNVLVDRVPAAMNITQKALTEDDFPSAAADKDGNLWVAYVAYRNSDGQSGASRRIDEEPKDWSDFKPKGNGDQIKLMKFDGTQWSKPLDVTEAGLDVYKTAIAVDGSGRVWVIWSQNVKGNWDLYARGYDGKELTDIKRLTTNEGTDTNPVATSDVRGNVHLAWQSFNNSEGQSDIMTATLANGVMSSSVRLSPSKANDWDPSITADSSGTVYVAYDTYDKGNYDVMLATINPLAPRAARLTPVANSLRMEARASVAVDKQDHVWVAWEERGENWGKDFGALQQGPGIPLYRGAGVKVKAFQRGAVATTVGDWDASLPMGLKQMNSFPRLGVDGSGRVFLAFRHRQQNMRGPAGTVWHEYVTTYEGNQWSAPIFVTNSDGLLSNLPALVATQQDLFLVYNSDGRQYARPQQGVPLNNEIYVASLRLPGAPAAVVLKVAAAENEMGTSKPAHPHEPEDVKRMRAYRLSVNGRTYQLMRGEFHRHTEISGDGGGDGSYLDMWRYGLDVADMDWIGYGDHDNGNGREYPWWISQKLTDVFTVPPKFVPMFTYERSVVYPDGHRNVMFDYRGVRTLPRLQGGTGEEAGGKDTKMLYNYLKFFGGICAVHTSATNMGTDWRDNDPMAEPIVEIYQGDRNNYEALGAPRAASGPQNSLGGWQPKGMVWNALAMGYRLGFQSSSDHISTHISYAIALAEKPTRQAILDAFKKRHCYAATDNIVMEFRCGNHLMGDEFTTKTAPKFDIRIVGTQPIARVDIVKDNTYVYNATPNQQEVTLTWQDNAPTQGKVSYYYVRAQQSDGQLVWASPMWIRYQ